MSAIFPVAGDSCSISASTSAILPVVLTLGPPRYDGLLRLYCGSTAALLRACENLLQKTHDADFAANLGQARGLGAHLTGIYCILVKAEATLHN
jgi:hypothetical protein